MPPPVLAEDCPNEKELELLALEEGPKTLPHVDAQVEAAGCPNAGTELNPG